MTAVIEEVPLHDALDVKRFVLGLDNVRLELPLAGLGSRILAAGIDHLLLLCFQTIWVLSCMIGLAWVELAMGWILAAMLLGMFVVQWGYFAVLEIVMRGRTPGKAAIGLRVMSSDGTRASTAAILIRNLLRSLDLLIGVPIMVIHRESLRLGDLVAGTIVIHQRDEELSARPLMGRHPKSWSPREVGVVESFLDRARLMDKASAESLASRLLARLGSIEPGFLAGANAVEVVEGGDPAQLDYPVGDAASAVFRLQRALMVSRP